MNQCNLASNRMMQHLLRVAGESVDEIIIDKQFASGTDLNRSSGWFRGDRCSVRASDSCDGTGGD
jgi:hypothetical protein